ARATDHGDSRRARRRAGHCDVSADLQARLRRLGVSGLLPLLAQSPAVFVALAALIGLVVGSFLNVVIYRLPLMLERQWRAECAELTHSTGTAARTTAAFNLLLPGSS